MGYQNSSQLFMLEACSLEGQEPTRAHSRSQWQDEYLNFEIERSNSIILPRHSEASPEANTFTAHAYRGLSDVCLHFGSVDTMALQKMFSSSPVFMHIGATNSRAG